MAAGSTPEQLVLILAALFLAGHQGDNSGILGHIRQLRNAGEHGLCRVEYLILRPSSIAIWSRLLQTKGHRYQVWMRMRRH